ncbi:MAG: CRISPR-associated helicase Cas3', partial [Acidobacteria bacterium ACB2]|nr:CRISPR-associated helicase Cas3' [Acidobacteria bacterium ACB2]
PTRGTATEGFRDYVGWAPESDAALVHASSEFELEGMAANPSEATRGKRYVDEEQARLFALGLWPRRYFSATVDQFLGFLEHSYRSLCLTPVLADCALVIDEIHSFDRRMFEGLSAFLREFDLPVLCMTATLSPDRQSQLTELGLTLYPGPDDEEVARALAAVEGHPRYAIEKVGDADGILEQAVAAYRRGVRVLWVVNTVARCQQLAARLSSHVGDVHPYHSRFKLSDRFLVHGRTIAAFRTPAAGALAVTTQVCEMSLDLDADLLITETAPIPSLVQRMGRANRHLVRGGDFRARVLVYRAPADLPYEREDHEAALAFVESVSGPSVSQARLAEALASHVPREAAVEQTARFLEAGAYATPGSFRDDDVGTARCVLDSDVEEVRSLLAAGRPIDGFVLPLPWSATRGSPPAPPGFPSFLGVVPSANYHPELGYLVPGKD